MVTDTTATDRLSKLQAALRDRGVVDVKFFLSKEEATPSKVANDAMNLLEAMLEGRTRPFTGLGDSVRASI